MQFMPHEVLQGVLRGLTRLVLGLNFFYKLRVELDRVERSCDRADKLIYEPNDLLIAICVTSVAL